MQASEEIRQLHHCGYKFPAAKAKRIIGAHQAISFEEGCRDRAAGSRSLAIRSPIGRQVERRAPGRGERFGRKRGRAISSAGLVLRRITGFFMAGAVGQLVGILTGIVQARTLGPEGKGVIAYAAIALSMALTATQGLGTAVLAQAGRDTGRLRTVNAALLRVSTIIGVPIAAAMLAVGFAIPSQRPLIAAALAVPFALYVQGSQGLLLATGRARSMIVQGAFNTIVYGLILIPLLVVAHVTAVVALALLVLSWAASAAYGVFACHEVERGSPEPTVPEIRAACSEQIRRGLRNCAASVAGYLNLRIDVFLVSAVLGARQLGIYTLAVVTGELLWNVSRPVAWSALDRVASSPFADALGLVARLTRNMLAIQFLLALVCAAVAPPLIAMVYGSHFAASGLVLQLLLPGMVLFAAEAPMGYFILVRLERPLLLMITQFSSALACAAISLAMFPKFGIVGAATATSVTYGLMVLVLGIVFCRATHTSPLAMLIPTRQDLRWYERRAAALVHPLFRTTKLG